MTEHMRDNQRMPSVRRMRRVRLLRAGLAALVFLFWVKHLDAAEPSTAPEQVLSELRAANDIRSALEAQRAEWEAEKSRLNLLMSLLQAEKDRQGDDAARAQAQAAKIRKESEHMTSAIDAFRMLQAAEKMIAGRLQEALDKRVPDSLPGVVPVGTADDKDPAGPLSAALSRLADAQAATKVLSVEVVPGLLDGEELAVRLLRAGDVAAWWISLDGLHAGTARQFEGKLFLKKAASQDEQTRIQTAFVMQAGQAMAAWLLLPVNVHAPDESASAPTAPAAEGGK